LFGRVGVKIGGDGYGRRSGALLDPQRVRTKAKRRRWPWVPAGFGWPREKSPGCAAPSDSPLHQGHLRPALFGFSSPSCRGRRARSSPGPEDFFSVEWRARIRSVRCRCGLNQGPASRDAAFRARRRRSRGAGCGGVGGHGGGGDGRGGPCSPPKAKEPAEGYGPATWLGAR